MDGKKTHQRRLADPAVRGSNGVEAGTVSDPAVWFDLTRRAAPILGLPDTFRNAAGIKAAKTLRITLDRVYPGAVYADACISEIGLIFADPKDLE